MSRITKWKIEKTKVKVVFRLQFHASHIPQSGWDKLFISFVPSDSGKATAKTTKANARNGTCKWADPIYETTRLLQDAKSRQYDEKLYKLIVAMGSSRAGILGEAIINLADYADASKPSSVSLPLQGCSSGTILHVTVQLLTSKTGFREFEQQKELREGGLQSGGESKQDGNDHRKEATVDQLDKGNSRVRFKNAKELSSVEEGSEPHEEDADSARGMDGSSNTSESIYAEKHDSSSGHEVDSLKSTMLCDLNGHPHGRPPTAEKGETSDYQVSAQGGSDSAHGWNSDYSIDNDLPAVYEENHRLRESLELAESTISELQMEINALQSQANEIGSEMHKLKHAVESEVSSGEEMAKDVSLFRSECSKFKDDIERLRNLKVNSQMHMIDRDNSLTINGVTKVEDRIKELQNKTFLSFHERDLRFLHSQLDEMLTLMEDIKRGTVAAVPAEISEEHLLHNDQPGSASELDLDLSLPESLLHNLRNPPFVSPESDAGDAMKNKMIDMMRELDDAKFERENLIRKMHQMESYYEALVQELEDNQKQMLAEVHHLRTENSSCLYMITSNNAEVETVRQDMGQQLLQLSQERQNLDILNKELERRAATSEALVQELEDNLKRVLAEFHNLRTEHSSCLYTISSNNAEVESLRQDTGQKLLQLAQERQNLDILNKELERRAATSEAALRRVRLNYSIVVEKLQKDLELLSSQVVSMFETNENIIKKAFPESSQEAHYQKVEELGEIQFANLYLDIFSKTLEEILWEANVNISQIKDKSDQLTRSLDASNVANDQLIIRLQSAMESIQALNDYKASCVAKFKDLALENTTLERNLETVKKENSLLLQKVLEFEEIITESNTYLTKYEASCMEKYELSNLLKLENTENTRLQFELSILKEELETSKNKMSELASLRENLDGVLQENGYLSQKVSILEGNQKKYEDCCAEKAELSGLWKQGNLENATLQNEILDLKEEVETSKASLRELSSKLDVSNTLVGKLQFNLESVAYKFDASFEVKDKHVEQIKVLLSDFDIFGVELKEITSKVGLLDQEILDLKLISEELKRNKSTIGELERERESLLANLQGKVQECIHLEAERDSMIFSLSNELHVERTTRENIEGSVRGLNSELDDAQKKLLEHDQQLAEMRLFKQQCSDLEMENSRLHRHLLQHEESLEKLQEGSSCIPHLQNQLQELDECLITSDVKFTFLHTQYEILLKEFAQHIKVSDKSFGELLKSHNEIEARLNGCLASEVLCREENAKLLMTLKSLRSDLEASVAKHNDYDNVTAQLKEYHTKMAVMEAENDELTTTMRTLRSDLEASTSKHDAYENVMTKLEEQQKKMAALEADYMGLQERNNEVETRQHDSIESEARCREENEELKMTLKSLRCDLEASIAVHNDCDGIRAKLEEYQKKMVVLEAEYMDLQKRHNDLEARLNDSLASEACCRDENVELRQTLKSLESKLEVSVAEHNAINNIKIKLEESQKKMTAQEAAYVEGNNQHTIEVNKLKNSLAISGEAIDSLMLSNKEFEIVMIVLKDKFAEQRASIESSDQEIEKLQSQCRELTLQLSEQVLKTEEFKNLSSHFKDLKDKVEADCALVRREPERPPVAQESLRMVFIKEQYETQLQELRQQLSFSRKHGEEMLFKLQDAINEIENRKKSEALQLKRNEELSGKLMVLEADLKSAIFDNSEHIKAYDELKAELECAVLSLECCKEEKVKVETSLREYKNKLDNHEPRTGVIGTNGNSASERDTEHNFGSPMDISETRLNTMNLRSSMEHLREELERMKNENSFLSKEDGINPDLQILQGEIMQVHKVNEQLRNMFPLLDEIATSGNALESVLALEIELAESLRAKNKSTLHFQSSFLKQHSDEAAVLKSFRDINELIREMLELKGKYATLETELKEMHDRYSQLSLQLAEVEGDRQKLRMTLKNVRASKKTGPLHRSPTGPVTDHQ